MIWRIFNRAFMCCRGAGWSNAHCLARALSTASRDYEWLPTSCEALIYVTSKRLLLHRIAWIAEGSLPYSLLAVQCLLHHRRCILLHIR
jgi:hypothetical protein